MTQMLVFNSTEDLMQIANFTEKDTQISLPLAVRKYIRNLVPIICLIGIVGNCMALMLIRTNFWLRRLTSNIYLCTLSICGCGFLLTVLATWADQLHTGLSLYNQSQIGCKLFTFFAHFCDFICVWMISWISCDRMIVLYRPSIRHIICTKEFARALVLATVLVAILLYGWCLVVAGIERLETADGSFKSYCGLTNTTLLGYNFDGNFFMGHLILDTVICTIVPSILIVLVNIFSTFRYRQCMRVHEKGVLKVRFEEDTRDVKWMSDHQEALKKLLLSQNGTQFAQLSLNSAAICYGKLRSSDLQLSRTLLVVTSTFVLLNVPNYITRTIDFLFSPKSPLFTMFIFITFMMYYLHHAVLFYMYIFWSPQMKKQLRPTAMRLLECYCFKSVPEFGHRSTSMQAFHRA